MKYLGTLASLLLIHVQRFKGHLDRLSVSLDLSFVPVFVSVL